MLLTRSLTRTSFKLPAMLGIFFSGAAVWGAACCGGGLALPTVIVSDDAAQISQTVTTAAVNDDVSPQGVWQKRNDHNYARGYKIDGALVLGDRWQLGASVPYVQGSDGSGIGDVAAQASYEYLPDWDYNPYRPKGLGYLSLTAPTGTSLFDGLNMTGKGYWAPAIGTILLKNWTVWDASLVCDVHHRLRRDDSVPGWGGTLGFSLGFNWRAWRFGNAVHLEHEDAIQSRGNVQSEGSFERSVTNTVSLSYLFADTWSVSALFSDQSIWGKPVNTTLSQGLALTLQKRWPR